MKLGFSLDKEDYLSHQLFQASQSKRVRKKRRRNWLLVPIVYLVIGILFYFLKDAIFLITFVCVSAAWLVLYPLYSRWQYKNYYSKFIDENYKNRFNRDIHIYLEGNSLVIIDEVSEGKVQLSEIDHIYDITKHVYLHMKSGTSIILPKAKLDSNVLDEFLFRLEDQLGIKRETMEWKWT